jgi:hypothetical protein
MVGVILNFEQENDPIIDGILSFKIQMVVGEIDFELENDQMIGSILNFVLENDPIIGGISSYELQNADGCWLDGL